MKYNKITTGFVIQTYGENESCIAQKFIASDDVSYEDEDGNSIWPPDRENYQPFDMVQPGAE